MTRKESITKGGARGKAGGSKRGGAEDERLASAILALAYRTQEERDDAQEGAFTTGGLLEVVNDLAQDCLSIYIIHPDVLPHALPVILREARAAVARKGYGWRDVRALLQRLAGAAAGEGGGR